MFFFNSQQYFYSQLIDRNLALTRELGRRAWIAMAGQQPSGVQLRQMVRFARRDIEKRRHPELTRLTGSERRTRIRTSSRHHGLVEDVVRVLATSISCDNGPRSWRCRVRFTNPGRETSTTVSITQTIVGLRIVQLLFKLFSGYRRTDQKLGSRSIGQRSLVGWRGAIGCTVGRFLSFVRRLKISAIRSWTISSRFPISAIQSRSSSAIQSRSSSAIQSRSSSAIQSRSSSAIQSQSSFIWRRNFLILLNAFSESYGKIQFSLCRIYPYKQVSSA